MTERVYRFGEFELNPAQGELRAGAAVIRLQEKPLLLLTALLERPQRLVTREELRHRMWDGRTVVDYEQGINVAMRKLRDALGDSADDPRFIETLARKGYRLLVPVEVIDSSRPPAISPSPNPVTPSPEPAFDSRRLVRRRWVLWTAAAIACAIALGLLTMQWMSRQATAIRSLAVLPLQVLSPEPGQEYFANGITEEITTHLAQMLPLRVISRTSAMRYKRTDKSIAEIAKELDVQAIVEGSIARSGNRVVVTVQLIDATEDRHIWAGKYDRRIEDVLAIEAELSQAIAAQISGTLNSQRVATTAPRRMDPHVHELVLLGRYHWNKRTAADLAKAEKYFQRAIALDPTCALAHAGLADVYAMQPFYGAALFNETAPKALAAAQRALDLDETLAEAHATIGLVRLSTPEWATAGPEFRRALELNPNYASAHHWYAYYLRFADRLDESCTEIELARRLDPLSAIISTDQGEMLDAASRFDEARVSLRRAIDLAPEFGRPYARLALVEAQTGNIGQALTAARKALELDGQTPATIGAAGYVLAAAGNTEEATKLLENLKELARRDITVLLYAAMIEAGLGRKDAAIASLEEEARSPVGIGLNGIRYWHAFDSLSTDPRFQALVAQAR